MGTPCEVWGGTESAGLAGSLTGAGWAAARVAKKRIGSRTFMNQKGLDANQEDFSCFCGPHSSAAGRTRSKPLLADQNGAGIDVEYLAGNEPRILGAEKQNRTGNFLRCPDPPQRYRTEDGVASLRIV